jgi:hypothetical protein
MRATNALRAAPVPTPTATEPTQLEREIGAAVAAAVTITFRATADYWQAGRLSPEVKEAGAVRLVTLYHLQQAHGGEIDFPSAVRHQGKIALRTYLPAALHAASEATVDKVIDGLLQILADVTRLEREFAN